MPKKMSKAELDKFDSKFFIWPYRYASASFKALAEAMKFPIQNSRHAEYLTESRAKLGEGKVIINWGSRSIPRGLRYGRILNSSAAVGDTSNKVKFFELMKKAEVRTPDFTTDLKVAEEWLSSGHEVFGRSAHGHSGTDITLFSDNPEGFVNSEFWVKYKKKKAEFRVHVVDRARPGILAVQQKVLRSEAPDGTPIDKSRVNFKIRNHRNGFIFQRNNVSPPKDVIDMAVKAFNATALDFGAFDVIYNEKEDKAYVLEVNAAPGLEGQTVMDYAEFFEDQIRRGV